MSSVDENNVDVAEEEVVVDEVEAPKGKMSVEEALKVSLFSNPRFTFPSSFFHPP